MPAMNAAEDCPICLCTALDSHLSSSVVWFPLISLSNLYVLITSSCDKKRLYRAQYLFLCIFEFCLCSSSVLLSVSLRKSDACLPAVSHTHTPKVGFALLLYYSHRVHYKHAHVLKKYLRVHAQVHTQTALRASPPCAFFVTACLAR